MKKLLLAAAALLMGATASFAQDNTGIELGANVSFVLAEKSVPTIGLKARYTVAENIRLDAGANYWLTGIKGLTTMTFEANANYLFSVAEKVTVYPLAGLNYTRMFVKGGDSSGAFGLNLGGGASYDLTEKLSLGAEFKYVHSFQEGAKGLPVVGANVMFKL